MSPSYNELGKNSICENPYNKWLRTALRAFLWLEFSNNSYEKEYFCIISWKELWSLIKKGLFEDFYFSFTSLNTPALTHS